MPRIRKHPDHQIQTFKYHVEPRAEIPQVLWDTARLQQTTWNALCELRAKAVARYLKPDPDNKTPRETMSADAKRAFWNEFTEAVRARINGSGLDWENAGDLLDRFLVSHQRGFKDDAGAPKPHHGLTRIRILHRFTGGGWDIQNITSARATRFAVAKLPHARHYAHNVRAARRSRLTDARFGLGTASISLRVNLHRPLPTNALVKSVALCGERDNLKRAWTWHIVVTVETEPAAPAPRSPHHAALDLGWRILRDANDQPYIRIGYLYDDDENEIELRLPLEFSTAVARRQGYPCSYAELESLSATIAEHLETAKNELRALGINPPGIVQMRQGGMKKFLRDLESRNAELSPNELIALEHLRAWQHTNDRLQTRYNKSAERAAGRRRWLYQNLAAWLTKQYGVLAWEGDLDIKEMAEADTSQNHALAASMTYRQIAAIGELRQVLRHAANKNNCTLVNAPAAYSTVTCETCGEHAIQDGALVLECPNKHFWDQDANAARNLFSQIPPDIDAEIDLRQNGNGNLNIPVELQSVAVRVHSE